MVETVYHWCTSTVYIQDIKKETTVDSAQHLTGCDWMLSFQYELLWIATANNKEYEKQ